jgi:hypothetical protein
MVAFWKRRGTAAFHVVFMLLICSIMERLIAGAFKSRRVEVMAAIF